MIVGKDQKLLEFFRIGYRFIIPAYQRNYDWKTQDCERLYDDLIKLSNFSPAYRSQRFPWMNCTKQYAAL